MVEIIGTAASIVVEKQIYNSVNKIHQTKSITFKKYLVFRDVARLEKSVKKTRDYLQSSVIITRKENKQTIRVRDSLAGEEKLTQISTNLCWQWLDTVIIKSQNSQHF